MKTPAGKDCKYFYGDYYRGRDLEECNLLKASNQTLVRGPVPHLPRAGNFRKPTPVSFQHTRGSYESSADPADQDEFVTRRSCIENSQALACKIPGTGQVRHRSADQV